MRPSEESNLRKTLRFLSGCSNHCMRRPVRLIGSTCEPTYKIRWSEIKKHFLKKPKLLRGAGSTTPALGTTGYRTRQSEMEPTVTHLLSQTKREGDPRYPSLPLIPYLRPRSSAAGLSKSSFLKLFIIGFLDAFAAAINSFSVLNFFKRSAFEGAGLPASV